MNPPADKTPACPPHYYYLDRDNYGVCLKCWHEHDFGPAVRRWERNLLDEVYLGKAVLGGMVTQARGRMKRGMLV